MARTILSDAEAIEAAQRSSERAAAVVRAEFKRGLSGLAIVTSVAPLLGLLGTVFAIPHSFPGCTGEKSFCMAVIMGLLSQSLMPTLLGLFVGIQALWCYRYLNGRMETFDLQMDNASVSLANYLSVYLELQSLRSS